MAKLIPVSDKRARTFGTDAGRLGVPEDFNAALADDMLAAFEK